ncbi:ABC transporter substrate-binding protein [Nonomuraea soli]|uniref:Polar amino acid transport system substrate-binding protein n=1 Tax=Nonomuraea soli TaxID=1032476 RepID=A0A7W0CF88_9ACTN|nr:ABC transporter substrate-binding protein [Nonomuraea soli]MBA2890098.1 polar amino acid transport system substrate-binding protein [Nonomuraea soli]
MRRPSLLLACLAVLGSAVACGGAAEPAPAQPSAAAPAPVQTVAGVAIAADPALAALLPERIRSAGKVRVATDAPYPPFEMFVTEGGKELTGIDYDLGQALGAKLGVPFEFGLQKFDGIIPAIQAGQYDAVMSAITDNKERQAVLTFVDYSVSGTGILVKKGNPDGVSTYTDLCGKSVAVQAATNQSKLVDKWQQECKAAGEPEISKKEYPKDTDAQLAIKAGTVVASLQTKPAAIHTARTAEGGAAFEAVDDPSALGGYHASPNGIGVANKDRQLAEAIQKALQALMDDGTYGKILATYDAESIGLKTATINAAVD